MAITYLKSGKLESQRAADDAKVRGIVESTLADIAARLMDERSTEAMPL